MSGVTLGNTLGAAYLGVIASAILFGVTNLQTYMYYHKFPSDLYFQKYSVGALWVLDAFHLSLTIHAVYHYLISSFGHPADLSDVVWSFKLQIAVNVTIILFVQSLYMLRIWKFGRHFHTFLPWTIVLVIAVAYGIGISLAVETYQIHSFAQLETISWAIYTSFSAATAVDFILAITMCAYLQKSRTAFSGTGSWIVTLMRLIVASGLASSTCSMAALITYATMPHTLIFLGIEFLLTKLYINSFLAMLNARHSIRGSDGRVTISVSQSRSTDSVYPTPIAPSASDEKDVIPLSGIGQDNDGHQWHDVDGFRSHPMQPHPAYYPDVERANVTDEIQAKFPIPRAF